ncbi:MFS transporter [Brevibacillus daliensis]|uniref:MFS transporter n=1 Tax=Brevibacillus daliensis TaxID=2892995 RepID=UPI001E36C6CB|nr:MFS transporter [Brevibacillus daliensis]
MTSTIDSTPPSLWRNRVFLIVASADLLQQVGIWVRNMALLFAVTEMTNGNAVAISLLTVFEMAPILIFSLLGGVFADRWNPKKTVVIGDLLSAISIVVIMICLSSGIWQAVFFATAISAIVSQFSVPSSSILFKRFVPASQVQTAMGITQGLSSLFVIAGPIIGTSLYQLLGLHGCLIVLVSIFLTASLIQLALPSFKREQKEPTHIGTDIKEGFHYVWSNANLRLLAVVQVIIGFGVGLIQPLEIFLVTERLGLPKESLQWLTVAAGIGMFVGIGLSSAASNFTTRHRGAVMSTSILFLAIGSIIEGLSTSFWLTTSVELLTGVFLAFIQVLLSAWFIQYVSESHIGRVNGIIAPMFTASIIAASLLTGFMKEEFSLVTVYIVSGIIVASSALVSLKINFSLPKEGQKELSSEVTG